jgi:hypothetical protein
MPSVSASASVDLVETAHLTFSAADGEIVFGALKGFIDVRYGNTRDGAACAEFSCTRTVMLPAGSPPHFHDHENAGRDAAGLGDATRERRSKGRTRMSRDPAPN